jgi:predicted methyltransferase
MHRRKLLASAAAIGIFGRARAAEEDALAAAIESPARSPKNVARDKYRHPAATLEFFGLQDDLSVLEIEPGAGYWTEILAPYLKAHGHYIVAVPLAPASAPKTVAMRAAYLRKLQSNPAYGNVDVVDWTDTAPLVPGGTVDLVLSFRNLHDWMADGTATVKLKQIYAALKPGGVFGIEDHRGLGGKPQDPQAKSGYVREDYAKSLIEAVGFQLAGESQIGDNPRDTKNYPQGVWCLPPELKMGAQDRAKYLVIGESDRWTLKFVKPKG